MRAIQATFQNGVFTPTQPVDLPEGSTVTLWIGDPENDVSHLRSGDRDFLRQLASQRAEVFRRLAE